MKKLLLTLILGLGYCSMLYAGKTSYVKVLSINIWGVPDILSSLDGAKDNKQNRIASLCSYLKSWENRPQVVLIQEIWDSKSAEYIIKNCGYNYTLYTDKTDYSNSFNVKGSKLGIAFFNSVKNEILEQLDKSFMADMVKFLSGLMNFFRLPGSEEADKLIQQFSNWINSSSIKSGLLVLSNYPIDESSRMVYTNRGSIETVFSDFERSVTKSVLLAKIKLSENDFFWVANTHLIANHSVEKNGYGNYSEDPYQWTRGLQIKEAIEWIEKKVGKSAVVFGGDFNTGQGYPLWQYVSEFLNNKKIAGDMNNESTYSNKNPYVKDDEGKLDHIFGMNGARPLLEAVVFKSFVISDHFGVLKSFAITQ